MILTLLTDFGTADYFVPAMKGVILSRAPEIDLVDITHEIPAGDVEAAAFVLEQASATFPEGTVHLAVVDPGVGSSRRAIIVSGRQTFVGPDNGLFSFVFDGDPGATVVDVTDEALFRRPISRTFHGRDVFAPVAAALAAGVPASAFGAAITDPVRLAVEGAEVSPEGVAGRVKHVDHFGNCVTNIPAAELPDGAPFTLRVGDVEVRHARRYYAEEAGGTSEPFLIAGSAGFLEVSVDGASAAERLGLRRGSPVLLIRDGRTAHHRSPR